MGGGSHEMIKVGFFTAESSPLVFKKLPYHIPTWAGDTLPRLVTYQHNFLCFETVKMTNQPDVLSGDNTRGDRFL